MADPQNERYRRFDDVTHRHRKLIRLMCWRRASGSDELCADLVQECYMAIWNHLGTMRTDGNEWYEAGGVMWQCRSALEHWRRRHKRALRLFDGMADETLADNLASEQSELIEELAADLSDTERRILGLILMGYTPAEIGPMLGIRPVSVTRQRSRIVRKMRQTYETNQRKGNRR